MKTWETGELITAEDLNALEQNVAGLAQRTAEVEDGVTELAQRTSTVEGQVDGLASEVQATKTLAESTEQRVSTAEQGLTSTTAKADATATQVDQIKLANQSAGTGAPTGAAPVGWVYTDLATGDIYRMEA